MSTSTPPEPAPLQGYEIDEMKQTCPAFSLNEGKCPYRDIAKESIASCPAFAEGCPFKEARTVQDLHGLFQKMPDSHKNTLGPAEHELVAMLQSVHATSEALRAEHGTCPVFSNACPFKSTASEGTPLSTDLEARNWSKLIDGDQDGEAPEMAFSKLIKEGTKVSHAAAENVHFVRNFIQGKIPRHLYKQLMADLYHVYAVLERRLHELRADELIQQIHFPHELGRMGTLQADMRFWFGDDFAASPETAPSPCTREYMARLEQCDAEGLVAHAYTRYMGDLSGGQTLMRRAKKALSIEGSVGLSFYLFEHVPNARLFKNQYRDALDGLELSKVRADAVVSEANVAFLLNMRLFSELDVMAGDAASLIPLPEALAVLQAASLLPQTSKEECPFAKMGKMLGMGNPHAEEDKAVTAEAAAKSSVLAAEETSGCPLRKITTVVEVARSQLLTMTPRALLAVAVVAISVLVSVMGSRM